MTYTSLIQNDFSEFFRCSHEVSFLDFATHISHISQRMIKDFSLLTAKGNQLNITSYFYDDILTGNVIIIVHGFKGFKDWGFCPYTADFFAKKGFYVITFNFSHNGIGKNPTEFTELNKFAKNTYSLEISELKELIDSINFGFFDISMNGKINLLGHSRGGAISLITASTRKEVNSVAIWASISKLDRYTERQKALWREKGFIEIINTRTLQKMKINTDLLDDIEQNSNTSLNLEQAVKNLNVPLLIAHGDQDLAVPIAEAEQIYEWSDKSKTEFYKIFGTGHTFDIVHPFNGSNTKFDKVLEKTANFFKNYN